MPDTEGVPRDRTARPTLDEVLALPSAEAAEIALRTQQVIAHETGVTSVVDPLGGSWYLEALTDRIEAQAEAIFDRVRKMGERRPNNLRIGPITITRRSSPFAISACNLRTNKKTPCWLAGRFCLKTSNYFLT